jgi:hypothetical protein
MPLFPKSPFPQDAKGLLTLIGLLPVGFLLFLAARLTQSPWLLIAFVAFVFGLLAWLYWRSRGDVTG